MLPAMRYLAIGGRAAALALLACGAAGCLTPRLRQNDAAYVYVAGNGIVTFWGEVVPLAELPERLKSAGATPQTTVKIVPQGDVSERLLKSIAGGLGRQGLRRVLIVSGEKHPAAIVAGKPVEVDPPDGN